MLQKEHAFYPCDSLQRQIQAFKSGPLVGPRFDRAAKIQKISNNQFYKSDHIEFEKGKCETDTRADTICAGKNFRALSYTGQTCDVKGFHDSFESLGNIPIARVATAFVAESGQVYILIINEALYFGQSMDHSLINPNQIRSFGIPVCNDPFDPSRDLGIDHAYLFVPFLTE